MKKRIGIQGGLVFLALVTGIFLYKIVLPHWEKEGLDELLDALGIVLVLSGFLLRISSRGYKEEHSSCSRELVKDGPYALMRNPMYFGTFLIGIGVIFVLLKLWTILLFLLAFALIYFSQIKKEEDALLKQFGDEYRNYCRVTPKYFPRVDLLFNLRDYIFLKLSWIKKEVIPLILTIGIIFIIEVIEDVKLYGLNEIAEEIRKLSPIIASFIIIVFLFLRKGKAGARKIVRK